MNTFCVKIRLVLRIVTFLLVVTFLSSSAAIEQRTGQSFIAPGSLFKSPVPAAAGNSLAAQTNSRNLPAQIRFARVLQAGEGLEYVDEGHELLRINTAVADDFDLKAELQELFERVEATPMPREIKTIIIGIRDTLLQDGYTFKIFKAEGFIDGPDSFAFSGEHTDCDKAVKRILLADEVLRAIGRTGDRDFRAELIKELVFSVLIYKSIRELYANGSKGHYIALTLRQLFFADNYRVSGARYKKCPVDLEIGRLIKHSESVAGQKHPHAIVDLDTGFIAAGKLAMILRGTAIFGDLFQTPFRIGRYEHPSEAKIATLPPDPETQGPAETASLSHRKDWLEKVRTEERSVTIGKGALGSVYAASIEGGPAAVKLINRELLANSRLSSSPHRSVWQEAMGQYAVTKEAMARGETPLISAFRGFGIRADGSPYILMDHLAPPWDTLTAAMSGWKSFEERQSHGIIRVFERLVAALAQCHRYGYVFLDLKPDNAMVCFDRQGIRIRLIDTGLMRKKGHSMFGLMGSPSTMSPEQCRAGIGDNVLIADQSIDMYALGCILYQMLTGKRLQRNEYILARLLLIQQEESAKEKGERDALRLEKTERLIKYLSGSGDLSRQQVYLAIHDLSEFLHEQTGRGEHRQNLITEIVRDTIRDPLLAEIIEGLIKTDPVERLNTVDLVVRIAYAQVLIMRKREDEFAQASQARSRPSATGMRKSTNERMPTVPRKPSAAAGRRWEPDERRKGAIAKGPAKLEFQRALADEAAGRETALSYFVEGRERERIEGLGPRGFSLTEELEKAFEQFLDGEDSLAARMSLPRDVCERVDAIRAALKRDEYEMKIFDDKRFSNRPGSFALAGYDGRGKRLLLAQSIIAALERNGISSAEELKTRARLLTEIAFHEIICAVLTENYGEAGHYLAICVQQQLFQRNYEIVGAKYAIRYIKIPVDEEGSEEIVFRARIDLHTREIARGKLGHLLHGILTFGDSFQQPFSLGADREALGSGGMGKVYRALSGTAAVKEHVAAKLVRKNLLELDRNLFWRFWEEAACLDDITRKFRADSSARGDYPRFSVCRGFGLDNYVVPYLLMEDLSEWDTLGEMLRESYFTGYRKLAVILAVFREIRKAVGQIHGYEYILMDLKPDNIMVRIKDGRIKVKLIDFGLAKPKGESILVQGGSPGYMAPEQWRAAAEGQKIEAAPSIDMYALGCVLFGMISGKSLSLATDRIFRTPKDLVEYLHEEVGGKQVNLTKILAEHITDSPALAEIIEGLLQTDPAARLTMAELTERLDKVEVIPQAPDTVPAAWRSFSGTRRPMRQRRMHIGEPGTGVPLITHTEPYFAAGSLQAYATAVSSNVVYVLESSDLVDQADASL